MTDESEKKSIDQGSTYSQARSGAECPVCRKVIARTKTANWIGNMRVRYHHCPSCGTFKSVEVDPTL
ncbi:MAG: hypothetical protein HQK55_06035 [Deltaproteobacteria bacterium]|nr:hypothetical protein [Deltaproteobacteria bacterium]